MESGYFAAMHGTPVVALESLVKYIEKPKKTHKRARINKKWLKRYGMTTCAIPDPDIFFVGGKIYGHPKTIKRIMKTITIKGV